LVKKKLNLNVKPEFVNPFISNKVDLTNNWFNRVTYLYTVLIKLLFYKYMTNQSFWTENNFRNYIINLLGSELVGFVLLKLL